MDKIIEAINGLWSVVQSIFNFVIQFCNDLAGIVTKLGEVGASVGAYLSFFPANLITVMTTILGVVIIYKIVGRD